MNRQAIAWRVMGVVLMAMLARPCSSIAAADADEKTIRLAVSKALPLIEAGARGAMEKRKQCFTCHNAGAPIIALSAARERGFAVDADNLKSQIKFTADILAKNRSRYLSGEGQGGQAVTAGYALWALNAGGRNADEISDAVTEYLLLFQKDLDHYKLEVSRPPTQASDFTSTYLALRGLNRFGTEAQKERIAARVARVKQWVIKTPAKSTEDHVFRLWALGAADAGPEDVASAKADLLHLQREDGGWGQLPEMATDAYATGTALAVLHDAGGVAASDARYRRGLQWLISDQLSDGSWHVRTRSVPIQTYFESGYPHKEDQFISIAAASWATMALVFAIPPGSTAQSRPYKAALPSSSH